MRRLLPSSFTAAILVILTAHPLAAQSPIDALFIDFDATQKMRLQIRQSMVVVHSERTAPPLMDPQSVPRHQGCAVAVQSPNGPVLLTPLHLVEKARRVEITLHSGERVHVSTSHPNPDLPIAVLWVDPWPETLIPIAMAPKEMATDGRAALTLSQIINPGFEVISRVHLLGRLSPPLAHFWVTDVVQPWGFPLITAKGRLLALPFRTLTGTSLRTMAAGPVLLKELLGRAKPTALRSKDTSPQNE